MVYSQIPIALICLLRVLINIKVGEINVAGTGITVSNGFIVPFPLIIEANKIVADVGISIDILGGINGSFTVKNTHIVAETSCLFINSSGGVLVKADNLITLQDVKLATRGTTTSGNNVEAYIYCNNVYANKPPESRFIPIGDYYIDKQLDF